VDNQSINWSGMVKIYKRFTSDIIQVINNPQADFQTTILVVAILTLILSVIGLLLWLVISSVKEKKQAAAKVLTAKHFEATRREVWANRIVFAIAVLVVINAVYYYGSQSSVCKRCHAGSITDNTSKSVHARVSCISCHSGTGVDGYVVRFFDYMRWVSKSVTDEETRRYDVLIANEACLRCHTKVAKGTVEKWGVRTRHSDFLEAGARCVDCHSGVAHGKALALSKEPTMDKCLMCHNNKKAPADCDLCHTDKASPTTRKTEGEIIRIDTKPMKNCRGCHPQDSKSACVKCHGVEMPHPDDWVRGASGGPNIHAQMGFTNKKVCVQCHKFESGLTPPIHATDAIYLDKIFCNRCHRYPSPHGSTERWMKMHGPLALKQAQSDNSCRCHSADQERMCSSCHNKELCSYCHNQGMRERE